MPKQYINYPEATAFARPIGTEEMEAGDDGVVTLPAGPQVGLHWDVGHGTVQLSFDMDADVLSEIVSTRHSEHPDIAYSEEGRATFYTETLTRTDLQRLIKNSRRARDAAYGADE